MPAYTAQDIAELEVVNQLKAVLVNVPYKVGVTNPEKIVVNYNYKTGVLSYDIDATEIQSPTPEAVESPTP